MQATAKDELVSVSGPFTKVPSGRFSSNGDPILVRCTPYWVLRYVGSYPYAVLADVKFYSAASALAAAKTFCNYAAVAESE
jgi:hypothetical protein